MSIGNILLRPQVLARYTSDDDARAWDLFITATSRLACDFANGGKASKKIISCVQQEIDILTAGLEPRIQTAGDKMTALLAPFITPIDGIKHGDFRSLSEIESMIGKIMDLLINLISELKTDKISSLLNQLADIVEHDLGIGYGTFKNFFNAIFEQAVKELEKDYLNGDQSDDAVNQFAVSKQIQQLRDLLQNAAKGTPIPSFNREVIILGVKQKLKEDGWDDQLEGIKTFLGNLKNRVSEIAVLINQIVDAGGLRDSGPAEQYSWYASWFTDDPTAVIDRFDMKNDPVGKDIGLTDHDLPVNAQFLEVWAQITYFLVEVAKAVLYLRQKEDDKKVDPLVNMSWQVIMASTSMIGFFTNSSGLTDYYKIKNNDTLQKIITEMLNAAGAFEHYPDNFRDWFWTVYIGSRSDFSDGKEIPELVNDFFLSLFTLINSYEKSHEKIKGFTALGRKGGTMLASLILDRKQLYYQVFSGSFGISVLTILGGGFITFACEVISWCLAGAVARKLSARYWRFEETSFLKIVKEFIGDDNAYGGLLLNSHLEFFTSYGDFWEGKTDDGKFGVKFPKNTSGEEEHTEIVFAGYPPKATSPYLLPFPKGTKLLCSQSHQDFSKHNFSHGLIYAVDFFCQPGQEVSAMREGTVVSYFDNEDNSDPPKTGYILIKHSDPPDSLNDKGENGAPVVTFARYENAKIGSIAPNFMLRGIDEDKIIGSHVNQGDVIMLTAERTGFFSSNFLQVRICVQDADLYTPYPSIPFVFKDIPEENGVPKKGKYYVSANTNPGNP